MVSIGLPAAPGKALGRPSCATFPDAPKMQRPPDGRHWRRAQSSRGVRSCPGSGYVDAMHRHQVVSQPTSMCSLSSREGSPQSSCRLGSRWTRLETSPLISSLARGSLGGQASWPRTQSSRSNSWCVCGGSWHIHGQPGPVIVGWPLSLCSVLCAPFSAFSSRLCSICPVALEGRGASTAPAGRPFGFPAVSSGRVIRPELGTGSRGPWAG